jgi:hypothetical protein
MGISFAVHRQNVSYSENVRGCRQFVRRETELRRSCARAIDKILQIENESCQRFIEVVVMCFLQVCGFDGLRQGPKYIVCFSIEDDEAKHGPEIRSSFLLTCLCRTERSGELQLENQVSLLRVGDNFVVTPSLQIRVELVVGAILASGKWVLQRETEV